MCPVVSDGCMVHSRQMCERNWLCAWCAAPSPSPPHVPSAPACARSGESDPSLPWQADLPLRLPSLTAQPLSLLFPH